MYVVPLLLYVETQSGCSII